MTREDLGRIPELKKRIWELRTELHSLPIKTTIDSVVGSRTEPPSDKHVITIEGVDERKRQGLKLKLKRVEEDLDVAIINLEFWIETLEESNLRTIFRLRYRNGVTWEEIGAELYMHRTTAQKKHDEYLKLLE